MRIKRLWLFVLPMVLLGAAAGAAAIRRRRLIKLVDEIPVSERRVEPDPQALLSPPDERIGFDLERLKGLKEVSFSPVLEFLNYIQVQRGGGESLLFVRGRDLESLAGVSGVGREDLLEELKKMGVLVSMN